VTQVLRKEDVNTFFTVCVRILTITKEELVTICCHANVEWLVDELGATAEAERTFEIG